MKRMTTDTPQGCTGAMLNMARAENGEVMLGFGDEVVTLAEYVSKYAKETGCDVTQESVMDGDNCLECDCPVAILNILGIQAAENNARLKKIEDILGDDYDLDRLRELVEADKEGRCVVMPVKEGETVYHIMWNPFGDYPPEIFDCAFLITDYYAIGHTVFLTEEEAEKEIEKMKGREKNV